MTLPQAAAARQLKHRRPIDVHVSAPGNGPWEVDAQLLDACTRDAQRSDGPRPVGSPIPDMLLRPVVDQQVVVEAGSETRWMPYTGQCSVHGDAHERRVGLNPRHHPRWHRTAAEAARTPD